MDSDTGFGLRPRGIGEILDLVFHVYRRGFRVFAGLGIVQALLGLALNLAWGAIAGRVLSEGVTSSQDVLSAAIGMFLLIGGLLVLHGWSVMAGMATVEGLMFGRPVSFGSVASQALSRTPHAVWTALLTGLLICAVAVLCCFLCGLPGLAIAILLIFAVPLCWLERLAGPSALIRSFELVVKRGPGGLSSRSNFVRILVVGFIVLVVFYALSILASAPLLAIVVLGPSYWGSVHQTVFGPQFAPLSILLPLQLVVALVQGLFALIAVIPWPLLYYDIRTRYEGLDLEMTVKDLGGGGDPPPGAPSLPTPSPPLEP